MKWKKFQNLKKNLDEESKEEVNEQIKKGKENKE